MYSEKIISFNLDIVILTLYFLRFSSQHHLDFCFSYLCLIISFLVI